MSINDNLKKQFDQLGNDGSINDNIHSFLGDESYTGTINDRLKEYGSSYGSSGSSINDRLKDYFTSTNAGSNTFNDAVKSSKREFLFSSKEWIGDFDDSADVSEWSSTNATLTYDAGVIKIQATSVGGYGYFSFSTVAGKTYDYSIECTATAPGGGHILIGTSAGDGTDLNIEANDITTYTGSFTATGSTTFLSLQTDTNNRFIKWDNISIKLQ